jgi:hypothetical protein
MSGTANQARCCVANHISRVRVVLLHIQVHCQNNILVEYGLKEVFFTCSEMCLDYDDCRS